MPGSRLDRRLAAGKATELSKLIPISFDFVSAGLFVLPTETQVTEAACAGQLAKRATGGPVRIMCQTLSTKAAGDSSNSRLRSFRNARRSSAERPRSLPDAVLRRDLKQALKKIRYHEGHSRLAGPVGCPLWASVTKATWRSTNTRRTLVAR